jgi:hypothetical protein
MRWMLIVALGLVAVEPAWGQLKIVDVFACYGPRGPERKSLEVVAGDRVFFGFGVEGVQTDAEGKYDCLMELELRDAAGALLLKQQQPLRDVLALGGGSFTAWRNLQFGPESPSGDFTLKTTVVDQLAKRSTSFERTVTCKKSDCAITNLVFFQDKEGKLPSTGTVVVGQLLHFRFLAVGFDRAKPQVKYVMLVQTLDKDGRELLPKAIRAEVATNDANVIATAPGFAFGGALGMNRTGEFRIRFTLIDDVSERKTELTVPIKVVGR